MVCIGSETVPVQPNMCTITAGADKLTQDESGGWLIKDHKNLKLGDTVSIEYDVTILDTTVHCTYQLTISNNAGPGPGPGGQPTVPLPSGVTPLDITSQVQTPTAADLIPVTENGKTWDCAYVSVIPTEDVLCKVYALADTELYAEPDMGGMFLCSTSSAESAEISTPTPA